MPAPTITGLRPATAYKVVHALLASGYQFFEDCEQQLAAALMSEGGRATGYSPTGQHTVFLIRPPVVENSVVNHGTRLYKTEHGYVSLLRRDVVGEFTRVPPEPAGADLDMSFLGGSACFLFNHDCAPGYVNMNVYWDLEQLDITKLEQQVRFIAHDHGTLRDGPCPGCEARQIGKSVTCPACDGSGEPVCEGHDACWMCGGNHQVIRIFSNTSG